MEGLPSTLPSAQCRARLGGQESDTEALGKSPPNSTRVLEAGRRGLHAPGEQVGEPRELCWVLSISINSTMPGWGCSPPGGGLFGGLLGLLLRQGGRSSGLHGVPTGSGPGLTAG